MPTAISVIVIAKNEEARLPACLESIQGWPQEIIVIDDESTDRTRGIAQEHGARVFTRAMENEGRHRNWAHQQAQSEWIFSLDADERLTPELRAEIEQVLAQNPQEDLFTVPRKNFIGTYWLRYGGQFPAAQVKLFRKERFRWEEAQVHPRAFSDGKCGHMSQPLLHYTYRDIGDYMRKLNNQTTLEAQKWFSVYQKDPRKADKKMNIGAAIWRSVDRFFRAFIGKRGWKDGWYGFMNAYFSSVYQCVSYAKYWEMKRAHCR